jgi:hypothetical protein
MLDQHAVASVHHGWEKDKFHAFTTGFVFY